MLFLLAAVVTAAIWGGQPGAACAVPHAASRLALMVNRH